MPTRKIGELEPWELCHDPDHHPAAHKIDAPGVYRHVCPGCGAATNFTVRATTNEAVKPPRWWRRWGKTSHRRERD